MAWILLQSNQEDILHLGGNQKWADITITYFTAETGWQVETRRLP